MSTPNFNAETQPLTFAERAAILQRFGIPAMPLEPNSKKAFLKDWQSRATTDTVQIASWDNQNPTYNCAAVARAGGFWIFEVDDPSTFQRIENETGHSLNELDTLVVKSSGEKRHFYFAHNDVSEGIGNRSYPPQKTAKEIFSVRAHNAYVVSAGSIHPTTHRPYEILQEPTLGDIPTAPAWLTDWIARQFSKTSSEVTVPVEPEVIPEGGRDNWLFAQACKLRDLRHSKAVVLAMLLALNHACCKPPMPKSVVEQKVESAFTRAPRGEVNTVAADVVAADIHEIVIPDMPDSVLVGRLGDIYDKQMRGEFPLGWSWLALVTVAGAFVPMPEHIRTSLYSCLVGGVHTGKSQCITWAIAALGLSEPILQRVMAGSAEGLLYRLRTAEGAPRLLLPDELGHLLSKSKIDNASFPYVLNRAYYETRFEIVAARGKEIEFDCVLSFIGGVVDEMFDELFGAETVGGLYDRCAFAQCPSGFQYDYRPCPLSNGLTTEPVRVTVAPEVWETKREWTHEMGLNPRVVETGLRVAAICASIDGRRTLQTTDLAPVLPFVQYQESLRRILKPNTGENTDGKLASKFLGYIERYGAKGEWLDVRTMLHRTRAYDFGVGYQRVLDALEHSGEIEQVGRGVKGHKHLFRRRGA